MATNKAAYLHSPNTALSVEPAPMPTPGPHDLIIRNRAVAINPVDTHMQKSGIFIPSFPAVFGCDVAGEVYAVGAEVGERFKVGDRVIAHTINLVTGKSQDGAYALYTCVPTDKTAHLPSSVPFTEGVVVPFALEAALCALCVRTPGTALPGVPTPALRLPYPSLNAAPTDKLLIVYGGSSSTGSMTAQIATLAGITVFSIIRSAKHKALATASGATKTFLSTDMELVASIINAVKATGKRFVGMFDAISTPDTYAHDLAILKALGGGHLACTHPPPTENVPENVLAGMIYAVNEVATPMWRDFVTSALEAGKLKCLPPPTVVGNGLESIEAALRKCEEGVTGTKLVVTL